MVKPKLVRGQLSDIMGNLSIPIKISVYMYFDLFNVKLCGLIYTK